MKKTTLCNTKKYENQAGMNLTPPPPSQELLLLLLQRGVVVYRFFGGFIARRDVAAVVSAIAVHRVRVWTSSSPRSPVLHQQPRATRAPDAAGVRAQPGTVDGRLQRVADSVRQLVVGTTDRHRRRRLAPHTARASTDRSLISLVPRLPTCHCPHLLLSAVLPSCGGARSWYAVSAPA